MDQEWQPAILAPSEHMCPVVWDDPDNDRSMPDRLKGKRIMVRPIPEEYVQEHIRRDIKCSCRMWEVSPSTKDVIRDDIHGRMFLPECAILTD